MKQDRTQESIDRINNITRSCGIEITYLIGLAEAAMRWVEKPSKKTASILKQRVEWLLVEENSR